jgi:hypothetical protein
MSVSQLYVARTDIDLAKHLIYGYVFCTIDEVHVHQKLILSVSSTFNLTIPPLCGVVGIVRNGLELRGGLPPFRLKKRDPPFSLRPYKVKKSTKMSEKGQKLRKTPKIGNKTQN